jgi:formylglycine-generating enzyme required for sulfatase activity
MGAEVWWDVSGIDEGNFLGKINQALQQCQWLVLVLTPNAVASKWVNIEVNAAINRREQGLMRGVLPMLASIMGHDAIPPIWDNLHRYDGVGNYPGEIARLARTLGLSGAPAEPPQAAPVIPVGPPNYIPQRLWDLGFRGMYFPSDGAELILPPVCDAPAGSFLMGSDPNKDQEAQKDEQPERLVTLGAYQIATFPVTVAEYACYVRTTRRAAPTGGDSNDLDVSWQTQLRARLGHPVVMVNWRDAAAYVQWLAARTGQPWRLPSEAEWEKAARWDAGTGSSRLYPWGDAFDASRCNTSEGMRGMTTPIGSYPTGASPSGALDMAGNVWEWTSSVFKRYPYNPGDGRERAESPESRVLRGGSWRRPGWSARAACRADHDPGYAGVGHGFRVVLAAPSA